MSVPNWKLIRPIGNADGPCDARRVGKRHDSPSPLHALLASANVSVAAFELTNELAHPRGQRTFHNLTSIGTEYGTECVQEEIAGARSLVW